MGMSRDPPAAPTVHLLPPTVVNRSSKVDHVALTHCHVPKVGCFGWTCVFLHARSTPSEGQLWLLRGWPNSAWELSMMGSRLRVLWVVSRIRTYPIECGSDFQFLFIELD